MKNLRFFEVRVMENGYLLEYNATEAEKDFGDTKVLVFNKLVQLKKAINLLLKGE